MEATMYEAHDDRRALLEPEKLVPREGYFFRLMAWLGLREKNQRDEKVAKAAAENLPLRIRDAERALRQPGVSEAAVEKALRVLGRAGRGSA
jgi:hypothetical protein